MSTNVDFTAIFVAWAQQCVEIKSTTATIVIANKVSRGHSTRKRNKSNAKMLMNVLTTLTVSCCLQIWGIEGFFTYES